MTDTTTPDEGYMTQRDAAAYAGVDPSTLSRWTKRGKVRAYVNPAGQPRYKRSDLDDLHRPYEPEQQTEESEA